MGGGGCREIPSPAGAGVPAVTVRALRVEVKAPVMEEKAPKMGV